MRNLTQFLCGSVLATFAATSFATSPGFYMGIMGGPASTTGSNQQVATLANPAVKTDVSPRSNLFGSRIFMGYKITDHGGVEGGLTYLSTIRYTSNGVPTLMDATARMRDFDLLAKAFLPIRGGFEVYAKGGAAATYSTTSGALNSNGKSSQQMKFRPAISLGISYDITPSWVADLSVNRTMVGSTIGNVDILALGISYHFVDQYCGQFLCG